MIDPYRADHWAVHNQAPRYLPPPPPRRTGPGRSSSRLPIAPVIVLLIVMVSSFPAGLVLLPLLLVAVVMVSLAGQGARRRRWQPGPQLRPWNSPDWNPPTGAPGMAAGARPAQPPATATSTAASSSTTASSSATSPSTPLSAASGEWPNRNPEVRSPFDSPAFWDQAPEDDHRTYPAPLTPPAWDPLGVAPFAWDLPEPPPVAAPVRRRRVRIGAFRLLPIGVLSAALLVTAGDFAGWWPLDWAAAAVSALAVLTLAVLGAALHQRSRS